MAGVKADSEYIQTLHTCSISAESTLNLVILSLRPQTLLFIQQNHRHQSCSISQSLHFLQLSSPLCLSPNVIDSLFLDNRRR
ncbi:hypothetical protein H5410_041843 [Solanum commersonii]|uniref:Uncharacterized protein n=1 Tax=Solanum commersonii TaxID=4109 RepID=A0A9J5XT22_SOLCO|nr:hypothetical protein H5410_041843 [Solanum commersonii]